MSNPILSAVQGSNADLLPDAMSLHLADGAIVADVTFGKGVFWRNIDNDKYRVHKSDLLTGTDFRSLPYEDSSLDCVILDPPYMHGGATVKASINDCYKNQNTSHESIVRLYTGGVLEAARVLKKGGKLLVKTQDEIESGKQRFSHVELMEIMRYLGFEIADLFVLMQQSIPAMREKYQKTARKNHSYLIVGKFRR